MLATQDYSAQSTITTKLMNWFFKHKKDLPWRRTYTSYHIWISEIMLQQTQMERVPDYFKRWIKRFPDIPTLAQASEDEVLKLWEGLGYYARAKNILKTAKIVANHHNGTLPQSLQELQQLPGIGPYTAQAIASIAFEHDVSVVDANVERVLARLFHLTTPVKTRSTQEQIQTLCAQLLPRGQARMFNQAIMEFGRLVCLPRTPSCSHCPLRDYCQAYRKGATTQIPVRPNPKTPIFISMSTGVLIHDQRIFIQKRKSNDIWADLWEFPGGVIEDQESPEETVTREFLEETGIKVKPADFLGHYQHAYTHYRVTMYAFTVELRTKLQSIHLTAAQEYRWATWTQIKTLAFPAGHRQLIAHLETSPQFQARIIP
jgi:A/G-specific adenine glycosylase